MRKPLVVLAIVLCALHLSGLSSLAQSDTQQQVKEIYGDAALLVDASGSMHPYYTSAREEFTDFLVDLTSMITSDSDKLTIYLFSKDNPGAGIHSPNLYRRGTISGERLNGDSFEEVFHGITCTNGGNTDLWEAISGVKAQFSHQGGVIWLLTDNIQDPNNTMDQEELREFYREILADVTIRKVTAFPINRPFPGCTSLPLLYGIVYAEDPIGHLMLESTPIDKDLSSLTNLTRIHCRPLRKGLLEIIYKGGHIHLDDISECRAATRTIQGLKVKSNYPSHSVRSNNIAAVMRLASSTDRSVPASSGKFAVHPKVMQIGSGRTSENYAIKFTLPPFCPAFSWGSCFRSNFELKGTVTLRADDVAFTLRDDLTEIMDQVYGLSDIPEFFHPDSLKVETDRIPITITVKYSLKRTFIGLALPLLTLVLLSAVAYYIWKNPQRYEVVVDGQRQPTRVLRWYGEQYKVWADEGGRKVLIGTIVYKWFRGMFFNTSQAYSIIDHESQSIHLPPKTYEFLVGRDKAQHNIVYRHISKKEHRKVGTHRERKRFA